MTHKVGNIVGDEVGDKVGIKVGNKVRDKVGDIVGGEVGDKVGDNVEHGEPFLWRCHNLICEAERKTHSTVLSLRAWMIVTCQCALTSMK